MKHKLLIIGLVVVLLLILLPIVSAKTVTVTKKRGEWLPASSLKEKAIRPATYESLGCDGAWVFSDGKVEEISTNMRIPNGINTSSSTPYLVIGWATMNPSVDCCWRLNYSLTALDEDCSTACEYDITTIATSSATGYGLTYLTFNITEIVEGTDKCIHLKITRDGENLSDTLQSDAYLLGICFTYDIDLDFEFQDDDIGCPSYSWIVGVVIIMVGLMIAFRRKK